MKLLIISIITIVSIVLIKEKYDKLHMSQPNIKAVESYHLQWIAISILWFVAGVFFSISYYTFMESGDAGISNSHYLAMMYYYIAIVYVVRGFSKDIICKECLWTSKGKVYWKDVSSCKVVNDDGSEKYLFLEVITKQKTIVIKFLKSDKEAIETLIEKGWC